MMLDTFNGLDGFENDSLDVNITPNEPVRVNNNNTSDGGQGYSPFWWLKRKKGILDNERKSVYIK